MEPYSQNKKPKLLHGCSLVLGKLRNGLDESFKEGLKAADSFWRAFPNSKAEAVLH